MYISPHAVVNNNQPFLEYEKELNGKISKSKNSDGGAVYYLKCFVITVWRH